MFSGSMSVLKPLSMPSSIRLLRSRTLVSKFEMAVHALSALLANTDKGFSLEKELRMFCTSRIVVCNAFGRLPIINEPSTPLPSRTILDSVRPNSSSNALACFSLLVSMFGCLLPVSLISFCFR